MRFVLALLLLMGCAPQPSMGLAGPTTICRPAGLTGSVTTCDGQVSAGMVCAPAGRTGSVRVCR